MGICLFDETGKQQKNERMIFQIRGHLFFFIIQNVHKSVRRKQWNILNKKGRRKETTPWYKKAKRSISRTIFRGVLIFYVLRLFTMRKEKKKYG